MALAAPGGVSLQLAGTRSSGMDVRTQNVTAVAAVANIVKTSLGPVGLDKVRGGRAACLKRRRPVPNLLMMGASPRPCRGADRRRSTGYARRCWWTTSVT